MLKSCDECSGDCRWRDEVRWLVAVVDEAAVEEAVEALQMHCLLRMIVFTRIFLLVYFDNIFFFVCLVVVIQHRKMILHRKKI
jgi:hypothetical protein